MSQELTPRPSIQNIAEGITVAVAPVFADYAPTGVVIVAPLRTDSNTSIGEHIALEAEQK